MHGRVDANDASMMYGLCAAMHPVKRATRAALAELATMSEAEQLHRYVDSAPFAQCNGGHAHPRVLAVTSEISGQTNSSDGARARAYTLDCAMAVRRETLSMLRRHNDHLFGQLCGTKVEPRW